MSWVVLAGIIQELLSPQRGVPFFFGTILGAEEIPNLLADPQLFRAMLVFTHIWQAIGWGSIIYFAAISTIDPELYEVAALDGAGRMRMAWHITVPSLVPVITVVFILQIGRLLNAGFDQIFKEFTELLARWWDMGLIDSEFFTIDRGASWEKAATGAFGVYNSNYNYVGRVPARPPDNMISDEDVANGVELVMFAPIGPRGEQFAAMYGTSYVRGQVQVMNKDLSDAKTQRVMEIVNTKYRLDDGTTEGIDLWIQWEYNHGEEGVHWEWAGEPYNSQTRRIPADERPADAPGRGGFPTNYPNYSPVESFAFTYPPPQTDWILNHLFGDRVRGQTFATEYFDIFNETDFREMSGRRGEALQTMAAEFFAKAVTGEIDIDAEWDNYVARWMAAGGNELMAEIAKMPRWSDFF